MTKENQLCEKYTELQSQAATARRAGNAEEAKALDAEMKNIMGQLDGIADDWRQDAIEKAERKDRNLDSGQVQFLEGEGLVKITGITDLGECEVLNWEFV